MYNNILLPVSNPLNSKYTLKASIELLDPAGRIIILSLIKEGEAYPHKSKTYTTKTNLLTDLVKIAQSYSVDVVPEMVNVSSVADAILDRMIKYDVDLTILGYSGQSTLYKLRYGDIIYPVLRNASSEVLLSNFKRESTFENILIPSAGYTHSIKAFEIAKLLAASAHGHITLLHVTEEAEGHAENYLKKMASMYEDVSVEIRSGSVADQIITASQEYDLLMMGASERSRPASIFFGTVVDKVIAQTICNVFVVKV
ncbi:MAG: universal stress protein [Halobacteriota archaeon]